MLNFPFGRSKSFGIDLGNNNTLITNGEKVLVSERSVIVMDEDRKHVKAIGDAAFDMWEKAHGRLKPVKPLRGGVIADQTHADKMIHEFVGRACGSASMFRGYDQIISGVPFDTTAVERGALRNSLDQFHPRTVKLIYEPIAAALGMGLNIAEPNGKMIVDIGGGITEIVIISLSGVAAFHSLHAAGDAIDEDIQNYFRQHLNMVIGLKTAEQIKIKLGTVDADLLTEQWMEVRGKDLAEGIPTMRKVHSEELRPVIERTFKPIEMAIIQTLEKCPPELAADIFENGIYMTGGNSRLHGIQTRLEKCLGVPVHIDPNALTSVTNGLSKALSDPKRYRSVLMD